VISDSIYLSDPYLNNERDSQMQFALPILDEHNRSNLGHARSRQYLVWSESRDSIPPHFRLVFALCDVTSAKTFLIVDVLGVTAKKSQPPPERP